MWFLRFSPLTTDIPILFAFQYSYITADSLQLVRWTHFSSHRDFLSFFYYTILQFTTILNTQIQSRDVSIHTLILLAMICNTLWICKRIQCHFRLQKTTSKYWNWSRNFHVNSSKKHTPFTHKIHTNHPFTHQFVKGNQASGHWPTHIPYQIPSCDRQGLNTNYQQTPTHHTTHPSKQAKTIQLC